MQSALNGTWNTVSAKNGIPVLILTVIYGNDNLQLTDEFISDMEKGRIHVVLINTALLSYTEIKKSL